METPRYNHWHQLDLIITRQHQLSNMLITSLYLRADCDTGDSLVCCRIRLVSMSARPHTRRDWSPLPVLCVIIWSAWAFERHATSFTAFWEEEGLWDMFWVTSHSCKLTPVTEERGIAQFKSYPTGRPCKLSG